MNTFVLSYNPLSVKLSATQLLGWIKESQNIKQWYSPFLGTYVLRSDQPLTTLVQGFTAAFDGDSFLISQISPSFTGGSLPPEIWNWINTGNVFGAALTGRP
jgi:hypothetical protein